jgi:nitroreductase
MTSARAATSCEEHVAHVTRHELFFASTFAERVHKDFLVSSCDAVTGRGDFRCDKNQFKDLADDGHGWRVERMSLVNPRMPHKGCPANRSPYGRRTSDSYSIFAPVQGSPSWSTHFHFFSAVLFLSLLASLEKRLLADPLLTGLSRRYMASAWVSSSSLVRVGQANFLPNYFIATTRSIRRKSTGTLSASSASSLFDARNSTTSSVQEALSASSSRAPSELLGAAFDATILRRHSCKRFRRHDGLIRSTERRTNETLAARVLHRIRSRLSNKSSELPASVSNPRIVQLAAECLEIARQVTPSAYNIQPYQMVLVHSPEAKQALSRYCLGPNMQRILDADCTVVFLADRQICNTFLVNNRFRLFYENVTPRKRLRRTIQFYITLFSSGYPLLPRVISSMVSFVVRTCVSIVHLFSDPLFQYPMPTLASAETWSSKQTTMLAMAYMLTCTSRSLATIPMEGFHAGGIRKMLKIPRRFAIPLIVATGMPLSEDGGTRPSGISVTPRYPPDQAIFSDTYGANPSPLGVQS